jgi:hypothetical protein
LISSRIKQQLKFKESVGLKKFEKVEYFFTEFEFDQVTEFMHVMHVPCRPLYRLFEFFVFFWVSNELLIRLALNLNEIGSNIGKIDHFYQKIHFTGKNPSL